MRAGVGPVEVADERALDGRPSWAFSVNEMARHDKVDVTLLTCTIVDDLVRITGLFRFRSPLDARLASIPHLAVARRDGVDLNPVSAHVLPHRRMAWVSWLFQRPRTILGEYDARIDTVRVDYQVRSRPPEEHTGPWAFHFELPPRPAEASILAALDE